MKEASASIPMPTRKEMQEAFRHHNELLKFCMDLPAEKINALLDFGYYNNAMKGYTIYAAREMELNEEQTRQLLNCFSYALGMMKKEEAERLYMDS